MPDLTFISIPWLEVLGGTAQALFSISYFIFVIHIWLGKKAEGVSIVAVSQWALAYFMLGIYFHVKGNFPFTVYYVFGVFLSLAALEGVRRYK